jgi:Zn-finger nucleic acid-binding protein
MRCVKCECRLVTVRIEDIDVDQCDRCAGIWFDAHELERVMRRRQVGALLGRAPAAGEHLAHDERRGRCPRCKGEGYLVRLSAPRAAIHVDTCAICGGKWLDGGEIDLLRRRTLGDRVRRLLDWVLNLDLG